MLNNIKILNVLSFDSIHIICIYSRVLYSCLSQNNHFYEGWVTLIVVYIINKIIINAIFHAPLEPYDNQRHNQSI